MAWFRLDANAVDHPKIAALTDAELRVWLRLLGYCAKFNTSGNVSANCVLNFDRKRVRTFVALGLVDEAQDGALLIHEWGHYQPTDPTAAERMRRYRRRNTDRNTDRNEERNASVTPPRAHAERERTHTELPTVLPTGIPPSSPVQSELRPEESLQKQDADRTETGTDNKSDNKQREEADPDLTEYWRQRKQIEASEQEQEPRSLAGHIRKELARHKPKEDT